MDSADSGCCLILLYFSRFGINVAPCKYSMHPLTFAIYSTILLECRDYGESNACSEEHATTPDNCGPEGVHKVPVNGCFKYYCYRRLGEQCYPGDETTACAKHLTCSCNKCMNCDPTTNECVMDNCPSYLNYKKRLPNRLLPWFDRARWHTFLQKFTIPNYED